MPGGTLRDVEFDEVDLYDELMSSSDAQLQDTAFGVIALDADHRVVMYNKTESTLSGLSPDRVVGRHFFSEVAPCTNNYMVAHRFETEAVLDATIDYVFTLRMKPTPVRLRLLARPNAARRFLLVQWS
jgi:photoactive yellow protein